MRLALLSAGNSIHTIKWANGLSNKGIEVFLISQQTINGYLNDNIRVIKLKNLGVIGYFFHSIKIKKIIKNINPDIVHAHYASGYGTTARLLNFRPYILSIWGSDIYLFPYKSPLHLFLIKKNILSANFIASTSHHMAEQIKNIVPQIKNIAITPFGVNINDFIFPEFEKQKKDNVITIGTVKTMSHTYGIDILLQSFAIIFRRFNENISLRKIKLKLRLVGDGPNLNDYIHLSKSLGIYNFVDFIGQVNHENVPLELHQLDIYVALSRSESFGVAVLEAGAAGKPVVVSNVGGLPEVVISNKTGIIVESENPIAAANAIEKLVLDHNLRKIMGENARSHVLNCFSWEESVIRMKNFYEISILKYNK
jgi:glycosyltransferase involved in cell wall biosynthesis